MIKNLPPTRDCMRLPDLRTPAQAEVAFRAAIFGFPPCHEELPLDAFPFPMPDEYGSFPAGMMLDIGLCLLLGASITVVKPLLVFDDSRGKLHTAEDFALYARFPASAHRKLIFRNYYTGDEEILRLSKSDTNSLLLHAASIPGYMGMLFPVPEAGVFRARILFLWQSAEGRTDEYLSLLRFIGRGVDYTEAAANALYHALLYRRIYPHDCIVPVRESGTLDFPLSYTQEEKG